MENTWNWDKTDADYSLLEKVNPVFNTAKMTLFQLAANGSADAAVLAKSMGLTLEATQNSTNTKASPEQVLGGTIMLETRYSTMTRLVEESGFTPVDIPCGYTPRAIEFARKGLPYYGLDLPVVIREISDRISALIPPEQREFVHYHEVDATNYSSLEKALEDTDVLYRFGSRGAVRQYLPHIGEEGRLLVHCGRGKCPSVCPCHARTGG